MRQLEEIGAECLVFAAVVDDGGVVNLDLLQKVLFDRKPKIAAAIVVMRQVARNGKDAAGLAFQA